MSLFLNIYFYTVEFDEEDNAEHNVKDVEALVALNGFVNVVSSILAIEYGDECLVEWHVEYPVHEEDHVAEEAHHILRIVFAVLQEVVHIQQQRDYRQQVEDAEDHERPIEEWTTSVINGFDHSTVVAKLNDEVEEKLVLPFKFL